MDIEVDMAAPGAERVVGRNPTLDTVVRNTIFGEGPIWDKRTQQLFFTDLIGDAIWKWRPGGDPQVVLQPSAHANGMTFDLQGRLVVAGWGGRTVFRFEEDGSITTLATHWKGKKINSPNDIVVKSDGSIYFTDPPGGMLNVGMVGEDLQRYLDMQPVFRIAPDGSMSLITDDFVYPNGLCFSPDEKLLYVNCTREKLIRVYDVKADGSVGKGRLFHQYTSADFGIPDGMKTDIEGNVYCTGPGGIYIHDPEGNILARLKVPGHPTNFAWGDEDWRTLYITFSDSVGRMRFNVPGVACW